MAVSPPGLATTARRILLRGAPVWIPALSLLLLSVVGLERSLDVTGGRLVLPLDDAYIQLSAARTFADDGTWGLEAGRFASVSSSPLWVLLLAATGGVLSTWSPWLPLGLDALGVIALVWVLDALFASVLPGLRHRAVAVTAVGVLAAVPTVAFSGTEHVLHAAAFVALLRLALRALEEEEAGRRPRWLPLTLVAAAAVALRFETLFASLPLVGLALLRRSPRTGATVAAGSAAPVLAHALLAMPRGGFWLPNPLLLKGSMPDPESWQAAVATLTRVPRLLARPEAWHLTALLLALILLALPGASTAGSGRSPFARRLCAVVAAALVLHVQLAALGSFYRYEMYLLVAGLAAVVIRLPAFATLSERNRPSRARRVVIAALLVALTALTALRAGDALTNMPRAARNIYEQQIQVARFVRRRGSSHRVAVNDLGAVTYLGETPVVDILGLADDEVARRLLRGRPGPGALADLLAERDADLLVAYVEWLARWGGPPAGWTPVESWEIRDNLVCAGPTVTFFAPPGRAGALRRQLEEFAPRLPADVTRHAHEKTAGP